MIRLKQANYMFLNNYLTLMKVEERHIVIQTRKCYISLLLLLPSRFSRVRLCATPWTTDYQASSSMGFSRQEHWSGLPFPSPYISLMQHNPVLFNRLTLF